MSFYVYLLHCADSSFYVGSTDDLELRLAQHQSGATGGYTARRRPVALAYAEELPSRDDARVREAQLKSWSRAKKEALIQGDWRSISVLARGRNRRPEDAASPLDCSRGERGR